MQRDWNLYDGHGHQSDGGCNIQRSAHGDPDGDEIRNWNRHGDEQSGRHQLRE